MNDCQPEPELRPDAFLAISNSRRTDENEYRWGVVLVVTVAYAMSAAATVFVYSFNGDTPIIYFAAGILWAGLLLSTRREWRVLVPLIFLAQFSSDIFLYGASPVMAFVFASSKLGEAVAGVLVLQFLWCRTPEHKRTVTLRTLRFALVAGFLGPALFAIPPALIRWADGASVHLLYVDWAQWALVQGSGTIIGAPAVIPCWLVSSGQVPITRRYREVTVLAVVLIGVSISLFLLDVSDRAASLYLTTPMLFWAAVRFGTLGSATASIAMDCAGRIEIETRNTVMQACHGYGDDASADAEYVVASVTDTGCGMSAEVRERVIEPFFTTKVEGKGSGLGLSMVYGFIKQSGGHTAIDSEPGRGTTVSLYLPRAKAVSDEQASAGANPALVQRGHELILVVEDDLLLRQHATRIVATLGYRVLSAASATDALRILAENPDIDLLFSDIIMPGDLNGDELARVALQQRPDLRVLFASGYTGGLNLDGGLVDGKFELLQKPYRREELALRLRQVLDTPRAVSVGQD
ncbi:MAG: hypothetical protein Cons2KO_18640 [Congregibacter sp.]